MNKASAEALDIHFLLSALCWWAVSSLIFLPLAAAAAHFMLCSEAVLAYMSAAISFLTAFLAGARAILLRKKAAVLTAVITGLSIIIIALTAGFLCADKSLTAGGILSVVSFSLAGALSGCVIFSGGKGKCVKRKRKIKVK